MTETGQVERAARRAIAMAKDRGEEEVTPDDLLMGALAEVSRFGIAWIGEWPVDVRALGNGGGGVRTAKEGGSAGGLRIPDTSSPAPAYAETTVGLFERAAALARQDGSASTGLVHLLAAFADTECGLMAELRDRYGFTGADWRAALARGWVGVPPRMAGSPPVEDDAPGRRAPAPLELLSVDESAEHLGVHAQTVRNYIRSGKLPAYRLAGERHIRLLRKDLLALLERVRTDESRKSEENSPEGGGAG